MVYKLGGECEEWQDKGSNQETLVIDLGHVLSSTLCAALAFPALGEEEMRQEDIKTWQNLCSAWKW